MLDDSSGFERFVALAKRDLGAEDVLLLGPGEVPPEASNVLVVRLEDGRHVVATFALAPEGREVLSRRLGMLAGTFSGSVSSAPSERVRARPPVASSLHEELRALAARARAIDVVVVDADSPVVWGSSLLPSKPEARSDLLVRELSQRELVVEPDRDSGQLGEEPTQEHEDSSPPSANVSVLHEGVVRSPRATAVVPSDDAAESDARTDRELTRRAVARLRALTEVASLHRGRHLRHLEREGDHFLALSFSGIYVMCLVFDGPFDELRAERAAQEALPRVERLVQALPPIDPEPQPQGGVVALRRGSRSR